MGQDGFWILENIVGLRDNKEFSDIDSNFVPEASPLFLDSALKAGKASLGHSTMTVKKTIIANSKLSI